MSGSFRNSCDVAKYYRYGPVKLVIQSIVIGYPIIVPFETKRNRLKLKIYLLFSDKMMSMVPLQYFVPKMRPPTNIGIRRYCSRKALMVSGKYWLSRLEFQKAKLL